ncbi:MAG: ribulokinase [Kiritimatiellia bacterium]|jgi:L-ribulokinase|nr:ribulokinase [Kiritimatiellia bacterium]MDP6847339.1 ribulokinase [Kiritimatiellia bacterium]
MSKYSIGLDYGTNSVRALIVDVSNGEEIGTCVWDYETGDAGIVTDGSDPNLARQHPLDYVKGIEESVKGALAEASSVAGFSPDDVIGVGVDTTGSTPLPVDEAGEPLVSQDRFSNVPAAMAWLWKDHTGHEEAAAVTAKAAEMRPEYLEKCGGTYSSEWYWSKVWHCLVSDPEIFDAAYTWVEIADWIPALLTGTTSPESIKRCICAAGHKAMFNPAWGGYPDEEFIGALDEKLVRLRRTLPDEAYDVADAVGNLTQEWAEKLGLPVGIPVAAGAFDAHLGGVGSGIKEGSLVKIIGTSTCDMAVAPLDAELPDIPGLCGIVPESILPGCYGLEAGQSAVGDIFNWYVNKMQPGGESAGSHEALTAEAEKLKPGESGLLALDWNNGNRTVLVDQRLTGLVLGMTLHTAPAEIYRALVEATAFGARTIIERFEEYGVKIERVINCGGISVKNPMVMQIYADVMNRPLEISRSTQTCALGSAMAGAVVAGSGAGGHDNFAQATAAMTGILDKRFEPVAANADVYDRLYSLYKRLHDIFGTEEYAENQYGVMKDLLNIRDQARGK